MDATGDSVSVLVDNLKWSKAREQVKSLNAMIKEDPEKIHRGTLESIRGYLLYLCRTYTYITPYIKGLHLTIDGWRPGRDEQGWRTKKSKIARELGNAAMGDPINRSGGTVMIWKGPEDGWVEEDLRAPEFVRVLPQLKTDAQVLKTLILDLEEAPHRVVRGGHVMEVFYGFGDASKPGFGATFVKGEQVHYRYGQWCTEVMEESSNYRELRNLVESLEDFLIKNDLRGLEMFLFTDNMVAESAFWKSNSSSPGLMDLIIRLRLLERDRGLILHVVHVSGKRMISQGTDGLSRVDLTSGVMAGQSFLSYVPLHLSVADRAPALVQWAHEVFNSLGGIHQVEPADWFDKAQAFGNFLWTPPPAAADVVAEQLGKARHKRPGCFHMVLVPRLMTGRWRRMMNRESDFVFRIKPGCSVWGMEMHEPALCYVCLPFASDRPWFGRVRSDVDKLVGDLLEPTLWEADPARAGTILREFLVRAKALSGLY